jgi:hypothetical protein
MFLLGIFVGLLAGIILSSFSIEWRSFNKGRGYNPSPKGRVVRPGVTPWVTKNRFPSADIHKGVHIPPKPPVNPIPPHEREE